MPIYEFECLLCKNKFEKLISFIKQYAICPVCDCLSKRIISPSNFKLKGNGWSHDGYITTKDGYTKNIHTKREE